MWSLKEGVKDLLPLKFSNNKTQEDIVREVINAVKEGNKIVFIHGKCGTGKSAVALNIAKELGRTSIVVPIKNLQKQYEQDYMSKKEVYKPDKSKLKISMITGRNNHECLYLKENKEQIKETRKIETNAKLNDIFKQRVSKEDIKWEDSADNPLIPCKIEIKEKNMRTLKKYYKENPDRKNLKDINLKFMKRLAVAPACPYWSPLFPIDLKLEIKADKKEYQAVGGEYCYYSRKNGCKYYEQFKAYKDADVILFNSAQYILETALGRKPRTEVEIIDECDEFLDNLAAEGSININRLKNEAMFLFPQDSDERELIDSLNELIIEILIEAKRNSNEEKIMKLSETKVGELIILLAKNDYLSLIQDEENYLESTSELCKKFYDFLEESYVSFYKTRDREEYGAKIVTISLDKVFENLLNKNKVFIMMSGTLHSERVLKEIYGIREFKVVEAETVNPGKIEVQRTGLEKDFKYENFYNKKVSREEYLRAFDKCVENAKKPCIVHLQAFSDLPDEFEKIKNNLQHLITKEEFIEGQKKDKEGKDVIEFKEGKRKVLFTTRCSRGIDFPYETCNSTVLSKFPYPNTQSLFWKILKKEKPAFFWDFYKDKAFRELLQRIYRSVRAKDDHVFLLSPDIRVLEAGVY